jgi:hypothetical protein
MNNKHIPTEMRRSGVSTVTLNRAEVHNSFITELPATATGKVTRRVSCQQTAEEGLLRRNPG